jgi:hypothetical protein
MCVKGGDGNFKLMLILGKALVFPGTVENNGVYL